MRNVVASVLCLISLSGCGTIPSEPSSAARSQLAPTGSLRIGVAFAPNPSPAFAVVDAGQDPRGVPVTIGRELAKVAGVPSSIKLARNSGELTELLAANEIDVSFFPMDETRKQRVDFGPDYFIFESTFLIRAGVSVRTMAELDQPRLRVIGISNTDNFRAASNFLKRNTVSPVTTVGEAVEMIRSGQADAFAFSRHGLTPITATLPGSVVLKDSFLRSSVAIAIPKGRPDALSFVSRFMEIAKSNGFIKRAFVDVGLGDLDVAP